MAKDNLPNSPGSRPVFLEALLDVTGVLNQLGIDSWMTDGTLLGYVREHDFLPHDHDIDIGLLAEDWNALIIPSILRAGFELIREYGEVDSGLEYTFKRNSVFLDLCFFYKKSDRMLYCCHFKSIQLEYVFPIFGIKEIEFHGHHFNIPDKPEQYLSVQYGKNWQTPTTDWNWAFSPKNCRVSGTSMRSYLKFHFRKISWLVKNRFKNHL